MGPLWLVEPDVLEPSLCRVYQQRGVISVWTLLLLRHDFHNHAGRCLCARLGVGNDKSERNAYQRTRSQSRYSWPQFYRNKPNRRMTESIRGRCKPYFTNHSIQNITRYTARGARLVQAHLARLSEGGPRAGTRPPFPADEPCRKPRCLEIADLGRLSFLPRQCSSASRFTAGAAFSSTKRELSGSSDPRLPERI
jgi:hypothetical protein